MLTYTLDLLTAQRFGQPTVGYGCETRDLCNVCVYKVMQFVTVKIKCDDIYIYIFLFCVKGHRRAIAANTFVACRLPL
jgi:hypothetical protein